MAKLTPQEAATKLVQNAKQAAPLIAAQVAKVTISPTAQAAQKIDKMSQKFNEAVASGKVKRGMERVSVDEWKAAMTTKGIPRIAAGLDQAKPKIEKFFGEFLPFLDTVQAKVKAMPDTTLEDSINRMTTNVREIAKFRRGG